MSRKRLLIEKDISSLLELFRSGTVYRIRSAIQTALCRQVQCGHPVQPFCIAPELESGKITAFEKSLCNHE
ncbi:MAG: hypothetical protein SCH71_04840 [Desulfobulbaceae bacterium]|nr:hypothetical protein [Desulfobulbaceae bacterium]